MQLPLLLLKKWYQEHEAQILSDYSKFLSFPSISTDPKYKKDVRKTAEWLRAYLIEIGLETELWETSGHPIVFGKYLKAGPHRPTVLIYQHYDVQPVDPLNLWDSEPFNPVIKNQQIYARGAVDNKGQCFYSINAIKAYLELAKKVGVNIKLFIEGEEESGGVGTAHLIPQKKEALKADHLLIVDLDLPEEGVPGITLGMRGIMALNVTYRNTSIDLHSGVHGGIVLSPNRALISVLAKIWDENGKVTIPGYYEDVQTATPDDLARLSLSFDVDKYTQSFGVKAFAPENGYSLIESNWLRPSLEINGISGGYTGAGFKTVIPAAAQAKISCRLVPNQDPIKIGECIARFLKANVPKGIEIDVEFHHGAKAFRSSFDSSIVKTAAKAYEEVFGQPCRYSLCGATIPIVTDLAVVSGAEVAMMGFGLPTDNIHAPNEHFGLDRFAQGFLTMGRILDILSES